MFTDLGLDLPAGDATGWLVPSFDPNMCGQIACDHAILPAKSVCGTCGYREWLTDWEQALGLSSPMTREGFKAFEEGTFVPSDFASVEQRCDTCEPDDRICAADPEAPDKQEILNIIYAMPWAPRMFSEAQRKRIGEWFRQMRLDYGSFSVGQLAECAGVYYWPNVTRTGSPASRERELQIPQVRRMDCLLRLWFSVFGRRRGRRDIRRERQEVNARMDRDWRTKRAR